MGIFLAFISGILFSSNYIFIQLGMRKSKKDNGTFMSLFASVICVLMIYIGVRYYIPRTDLEFNWLSLFYFLLAGFFSAFIGRVFLFAGIRSIGSPRAAAIKNTAPAFTVFIAILFLGEHLSLWGSVGMSVIFLSLMAQARYDFKSANKLNALRDRNGLIFALLAALFVALGQASRKQGIVFYADPILGSLVGLSFALVTYSLSDLLRGKLKETLRINFKTFNPYFIAAGVGTAGAQISFFLSLMYTKLSYTSVISATEPVLTVILSAIFLQKEEHISWRIILTATAVFLGSFIIVTGQ